MGKNMEKALITMHQVINILDSGLKIKRMEMVFCSIKMGQFMMVNGQTINLLIKDRSYMQTKINIKEHF